MCTVLITGGSGLLANAMIPIFLKEYDVVCAYLNNKPRWRCKAVSVDLTVRKDVLDLIKGINPKLIIHCAAITDVDYCESNGGKAFSANAESTQYICEAASICGSKVIYVSSDFVFDGDEGNYSEEDMPNPINVYGKTKLEGEKYLRESDLIIRTAIFGWNQVNKKGLAEKIIHDLREKKNTSLFTDLYFTPIYTVTLASIIFSLNKSGSSGIFHVVSDDRVSKYDFGLKIAGVFGLQKELICKSSVKNINFIAKRPIDCSLDNKKVKTELNIEKISLKADIERMMKDERIEN